MEERRMMDGWRIRDDAEAGRDRSRDGVDDAASSVRDGGNDGTLLCDRASSEAIVSYRKPELLAPAGNMEAFRAALLAGADAVYLGLPEFNARRNADNLTLEDLKAACRMAHLAGKRVYLTLNTAILQQEVADALSLVDAAYLQGIDAVIVQDLGIMELLVDRYPDLEVHTSTQMNILNREGVMLAKRLGAARVTLARELSLSELTDLASLGVDLEVFAHGALCICCSGQCLMSSLIGRRSANRGLCAQPCRLPYELYDASGSLVETPGERLLSPRDLCTIDILPQLMATGVASLKIEGRMKSADYVATVVSIYRGAIDRAFSDPDSYAATSDEHDRLAEAFSRGFTTAYLTGERGNDMMSYTRSNNRGVLAGRVSSIRDGLVQIAAEKPLRVGDQLEFWTIRGRHAEKLTAMYVEGVPVASCAAGERPSFPVARPVAIGDRVFRVRSEELQSSAEALYEKTSGVPQELFVHVDARKGTPLSVSVRDREGRSGSSRGPVVEEARTKPVTRDDVVEHVGRLGGTPYSVAEWEIDLDDGIGLGFSQLHNLRKAAIEAYEDGILAPWSSRVGASAQAASPSSITMSPVSSPSGVATPVPSSSITVPPVPSSSDVATPVPSSAITVPPSSVSLAMVVATREMLACAREQGIETIYVPALELVEWMAEEPDMSLSDIVALMPTVAHDGELSQLIDVSRRCGAAVADGLGLFPPLLDAGVRVEGGPRTNVFNPSSIRALSDVGADRLWLSPELSLPQIADLAIGSPIPFSLTVFGRQELMVTEHCELMAQGPCARDCPHCQRRRLPYTLHDRKGYDFPVTTDRHGRGHIYNAVELDLVPTIPELLRAGVSRFTIDASLIDVDRAYMVIARARKAIVSLDDHPFERLDGTTTGHIFRGVL